jgi:hypothetical protein
MRHNVCIALLCVSSAFALGQSTDCLRNTATVPLDKTQGLLDTLTESHISTPISDAEASAYSKLWNDLTPTPNDLTPKDSSEDFKKLIEATTCPLSETKISLSTKYLYVLHLIDWENETKSDKNPVINYKSSTWYVYRYAGKQFEFIPANKGKLPSIYEKTNIILLSISRINTVENSTTESLFIEYSVASQKRNASNVDALSLLISKVFGIDRGVLKSGPEVKPTYRYSAQAFAVSTKSLQAPFDVTFTATAKPANTANGQVSSASPAPDADASSADKNTQKSTAASTSTPAKETDCKPLTSSGKCYFSRTFSVEAYQYWNVGINIVTRGPRENKYALSSSGVVTQTHTLHAPLIAAFDISPWARKLPMDKYPYIQVGVPLSGSAFHMPYFGLAQPLRFTNKWLPISVYGGVVLMKQTFPKTIQVGQTTTTAAFNNDLKTDWPVKAVYGIEVPVSSIINKVKSSVGSGK